MSKRFLRTDWMRFSKLGKNRKKKQKWRRATGRHNKIRKKRMGYPVSPKIGYSSNKKEYGKIHGMKPVLVYNLKDLSNVNKDSIVIIGKIGARKKLELIKKAGEMKLKISNVKMEAKNDAVK